MAISSPPSSINNRDPAVTQKKIQRTLMACSGIYLLSGIIIASIGGVYSMADSGEKLRVDTITHHRMIYLVFVGVYISFSSSVAIFASLAPLKRRRLLKLFAAATVLIIVFMFCLIVWLWTRTLNMNNVYRDYWREDWSETIKMTFENDNRCCGYLNPNDAPIPSSKSCQDSTIKNGCMYPVIFYVAEKTMYMYGGIITCALLGLITAGIAMTLSAYAGDQERMQWAQSRYGQGKLPHTNTSNSSQSCDSESTMSSLRDR